jgi:hypothetical protein
MFDVQLTVMIVSSALKPNSSPKKSQFNLDFVSFMKCTIIAYVTSGIECIALTCARFSGNQLSVMM